MNTVANIAVALVALLHLCFLVLDGALTVNRRILWVQAFPGAAALALVLASR